MKLLVIRPRNSWTRTRSDARIREAVVSVERVRTRGREILYVCSDSAPESDRNLDWRIAGNEVATDDVPDHLSACAKIETVDVSANLIILNQVVLAYTQESQTEIVAVGGGGG